jgi:precorrin-6Y C5,15-methyltransferase (decarboxylating)
VTRWLAVVGFGEDGLDGLSPRARALIAEAEITVKATAPRWCRRRGRAPGWASPLGDTITLCRAAARRRAASGDLRGRPGQTRLRRRPEGDLVLPAPSSLCRLRPARLVARRCDA